MRDIEELIKALSDEDKTKEDSEERKTNLPKQTPSELSMEYLRTQIERLKEENESLKQDRKLRKELGEKIYSFVVMYMFCVLFVLVLSGVQGNCFVLSDTVLVTIFGTTTANVIGVLVIVVTYYFNKNKKKE